MNKQTTAYLVPGLSQLIPNTKRYAGIFQQKGLKWVRKPQLIIFPLAADELTSYMIGRSETLSLIDRSKNFFACVTTDRIVKNVNTRGGNMTQIDTDKKCLLFFIHLFIYSFFVSYQSSTDETNVYSLRRQMTETIKRNNEIRTY